MGTEGSWSRTIGQFQSFLTLEADFFGFLIIAVLDVEIILDDLLILRRIEQQKIVHNIGFLGHKRPQIDIPDSSKASNSTFHRPNMLGSVYKLSIRMHGQFVLQLYEIFIDHSG